MFFNVSREKSGRPGRSGDVMDAVGLSPPIPPRNLLHAKMAHEDNVQARPEGVRVEGTINKTKMEGARDRRCNRKSR